MVTSQLWYYGVSWVIEVMLMTHSSENNFNRGVSLIFLTRMTVDISKYLELGFYEKFCFKENSGLSPSATGMWLGI